MIEQAKKVMYGLLSGIPSSLAVRESMRLVALLKHMPAEGGTVLDVGCGDGSFWLSYPHRANLNIDGVDLNVHEIDLAKRSGVYRNLWAMDISRTNLLEKYNVALGNCSMEHIPNINQALKTIHSSLHHDGLLLMFVPAFGWTKSLRFVNWLTRRSQRLGMALSGAIDGFFQHHHLYDDRSWSLLVQNAGFRVEACLGLGSPEINRHFERNLPVAFLEFVFKSGMRCYPPSLGQRRSPPEAFWAELAAQPVSADSPDIVEYLIVARPQ